MERIGGIIQTVCFNIQCYEPDSFPPVVECLFSIRKTLGVISSATKQNKAKLKSEMFCDPFLSVTIPLFLHLVVVYSTLFQRGLFSFVDIPA